MLVKFAGRLNRVDQINYHGALLAFKIVVILEGIIFKSNYEIIINILPHPRTFIGLITV